MGNRLWSAFVIAAAMLTAPALFATEPERATEPWPALLDYDPVNADPDVAALHLRAVDSLERVMNSQAGSLQDGIQLAGDL